MEEKFHKMSDEERATAASIFFIMVRGLGN